ncbi:uncharacterized protein LOC122254781 [Penaeus japonicus]|uniref:uncharacterized protein LOC122254781 n=1 Tax=Penaeus japonicus TaxID=27405 RepID=UPI001C70C41A|nr:uncharacterized protein LOC122254781 [Penaeus japonicus]
MAIRISLAMVMLLAVVASGRILDGSDGSDDLGDLGDLGGLDGSDGLDDLGGLAGLEGDDLQLNEALLTDGDGSALPSGVSGEGRTMGASFGNIVYSVIGFVLGGSLMFISLFDITRKPVIMFFDQIFGARQNRRRRREAGQGLESRVAVAFDTLAAALDKMETISKIANSM